MKFSFSKIVLYPMFKILPSCGTGMGPVYYMVNPNTRELQLFINNTSLFKTFYNYGDL